MIGMKNDYRKGELLFLSMFEDYRKVIVEEKACDQLCDVQYLDLFFLRCSSKEITILFTV
jgi:hypothetical protein